jgi:phage replication-related protein YjqB (UPF0714/DUF867 family)
VFADLLRQPGVEEHVELRSTFGFLAFHGGSLEQVTDVIADEAARRSGASLYTVVQPPELRWHIPSKLVTPDASPALARFLGHVDVGIAVHGYGRTGRWTDLLLGGGNRPLAHAVAAALSAALPDYRVICDLAEIPPELRGLHPDNPINRPAAGGVQLELPPRVRGQGPMWADWPGPGLPPPTEALIDALAGVAREAARQSVSKVPPARQ